MNKANIPDSRSYFQGKEYSSDRAIEMWHGQYSKKRRPSYALHTVAHTGTLYHKYLNFHFENMSEDDGYVPAVGHFSYEVEDRPLLYFLLYNGV